MEISYCGMTETCHITCVGSCGEDAIEAIVGKIDELFPGRILSDIRVIPPEDREDDCVSVKFHSEDAPAECRWTDEPLSHLPVDECGSGFLFSRIFVLGNPSFVLHVGKGPGNSLSGLRERIKEIGTDVSFDCVPGSLEVMFLFDEKDGVYRPAIRGIVERDTKCPPSYRFSHAIPDHA
ncbi:MAG: hypothetical protein HGA31_03850 [Candidatus Moranbacteria bacterium]|nr:hypothetical protein [Candidatus Moranbacteria bacterium]